jgi:hypothetical protein
LAGVDILTPEDVFSDASSVISGTSSVISGTSSVISDASSVISGGLIEKNNHNRDSSGRLCSEKLVLPVIDDLSALSEPFKAQLYKIAIEARSKQRLAPELMEHIILKLCEEQFFTLGALAEVLNRKPEALRRGHLTRMIRTQKICLAFPTKPTHEKQAYRSNTEISHTKN